MRPAKGFVEVRPSSEGRVAFKTTSLFAQTGLGWYGPVLYVGNTIQPITRGEARRLARAILKITDKP